MYMYTCVYVFVYIGKPSPMRIARETEVQELKHIPFLYICVQLKQTLPVYLYSYTCMCTCTYVHMFTLYIRVYKYMYMYTCIYVYMCICTCTYACSYVRICLHVLAYMYTCKQVYIYIYKPCHLTRTFDYSLARIRGLKHIPVQYICTCVCMHICLGGTMYTWICICVYIYICMHNRRLIRTFEYLPANIQHRKHIPFPNICLCVSSYVYLYICIHVYM